MNNVTKIIAIFLIVSVTINLVIFSYYTEKGYTVGTILEKFSDNENNLDLPKMMLRSESYYFDNYDVGRIYIVYRMINPEVNGAPTTKYKTETLSEYFVNNLNKYPKHKKFLENWSKLQSIRHNEFVKKLKVKKSNKLDLDKYIGDGNVKKMENKNLNVKKKKEKNQEIIELEQLYEEGIITKEELEKAKELVN